MRRFFRRWSAQFQRGIFAYLFKPFLDLAFLIKQPLNPRYNLVALPKSPLPWRERAGVRGELVCWENE
jgi:hypothetical protein